MEEEKIVVLINEKETCCDIIFTFDCDDTGKSYVAYSDNTIGDNGRKNIYVSTYDPIIGMGNLEDIETQEEWDMVKDVLDEVNNGNV